MSDDLELPAVELKPRRHELVGSYVTLTGKAQLVGLDLSGIDAEEITIAEGLRAFLPARVRRPGVRFIECDFSGLRVPAFDPTGALFERCRFDGIRVKFTAGAARPTSSTARSVAFLMATSRHRMAKSTGDALSAMISCSWLVWLFKVGSIGPRSGRLMN